MPSNTKMTLKSCQSFSLQDILENDDLHLDDMFIASLVFDLIRVSVIILLSSKKRTINRQQSTNIM